MKTCSKCKVEQDTIQFVKSDKYKDGLYPSCKTCRKAARIATLAANPMCSKCGENTHTETNAYCYDCLREARGQSPVPKFTRDSTNSELCSKCKINPRLDNHNYCNDCRIEYNRVWMQARGGQYQYMCDKGDKGKVLARAYLNQNCRRGKIQKLPCKLCGAEIVEGHHYLGYDREHYLDVIWLCVKHHRDVTNGIIVFDERGELVQ